MAASNRASYTKFLNASWWYFVGPPPAEGAERLKHLPSLLYHFEAKGFLNVKRDGRARPAGGRALTAAASAQRALAAAQKESL